MCVWGGLDDGWSLLTSGGCYDPALDRWTAISNTGGGTIPSSRYYPVLAWVQNRLCIWGGDGVDGTAFGNGGCYNPATDGWTAITPPAAGVITANSVREGVDFVHRDQLCIWGAAYGPKAGHIGSTLADPDNRGACYDYATDTWSAIEYAGSEVTPKPRAGAGILALDDRFCVWGGATEHGPSQDGECFLFP